MARPIEPTPALAGEDAQRLRTDLKQSCSADEARRRMDQADRLWKTMQQPRGSDKASGR